jgi:two-component system response regulator YesN
MIRALIVDDEKLVRKGLRLIFPWEKYNIEIVGEAATGEKALDFIRTNRVQLLFTDITMPGMSGLELFRLVQDFDASIKVVILTCHQDFDYIQEALRMGAIDYIVKTQLENQNMDEVLKRIAKAAASIPDKPGSGIVITLPNREEMLRELSHLLWIVDDTKFDLLQTCMIRAGTEVNFEWPEVMIGALQHWKNCFPQYKIWGTAPERLFAQLQAIEWIKEIRTGLQSWLRQSLYSEEVIYAIVKAVEHIQETNGFHVRQSDICRQVNLSKSYFSISFKDIMGISFIHYVQRKSIEDAKAMLRKTNHPIYWIAEQCGFMDQRYFSKMFKEQTGLLPSEFRQKEPQVQEEM